MAGTGSIKRGSRDTAPAHRRMKRTDLKLAEAPNVQEKLEM